MSIHFILNYKPIFPKYSSQKVGIVRDAWIKNTQTEVQILKGVLEK